MNQFNITFYHGNCSDGNACLYLFKKNNIPLGTIIKYTHKLYPFIIKILKKAKNLNILFLDIMPSKEIISLIKPSNKILIIDHHKKCIEYSKNIEIIHNINKSACQLTWSYLYKNDKYPNYINYIADRDLWKFKLKGSKIINNGFFHLNLTSSPESIEKLSKIKNYSEIKIIGKTIEEIKNNDIKFILLQTKFAKDPYNNIVTITDCPRKYRSECGNKMLNLVHFKTKEKPVYAVIWKYVPDLDEYWISLRSNGFDVTSIFKEYGCGGHKRAGGFTLKGKKLKDIFKFF